MKILMIGPISPPYGGIANFIENIAKQEVLKDIKIRIHRVGRRKNDINLFRHFFAEIFDILCFVAKNKFRDIDIVHIHTASNWSFFRTCIYFFIIRLASNDKILIHIHGGKFDSFYDRSFLISKKLIRYVLSNCDAIIVTSSKWTYTLKNIIRHDTRTFVIYNGFNDKLFMPIHAKEIRCSIDIPLDKKILLNVGSLEEHKGHKFLIETMEIIKKKRNDVLVYIVGEGSLMKGLERTIVNKGLGDNVFLLGRREPIEIRDLINACDIFILPSLVEGNPTVMFETLGCGKPFIGTKVGGVQEIISSSDYGFIVEPEDPKDMAKKILVALNKEWSSETINKYAQRFTWDNISKDVLQIYKSVYP